MYALIMYASAIILYVSKSRIQKELNIILVYIIKRFFPGDADEDTQLSGRRSVMNIADYASGKSMSKIDEENEVPKDLYEDEDEGKEEDDTSMYESKNQSGDINETNENSSDDEEQQGSEIKDLTKPPRNTVPAPPAPPAHLKNKDEESEEVDELELAVFHKDATRAERSIMAKLKGVIGAFQIIMVLKGDIDVEWPTMWTGFSDSLSFLAVNPMALPLTACAWTFTFYQKFIIIMIGPLFVVCVITPLMFLITKYCTCCPKWWPEVRGSTMWQVSFFVPFLVYPIACQYIGKMFICDTLENGKKYLVADYSQECFQGEHMAMVTFALPFVFIYPIGVPVYFAWALNEFSAVLYDPTGARDEMGRAVEPLPKTKKKLGFLYATYGPHAAWYELVELFRKFFFTLAMIFVSPMYPNQLYAGLLACVLFSLTSSYVCLSFHLLNVSVAPPPPSLSLCVCACVPRCFISPLHTHTFPPSPLIPPHRYIKPFSDIYSQINAQLVDLALFFVMAGALSLKVSESYPENEQASSVDLAMTITTIAPIAFVLISMVMEMDMSQHFINDLSIKLRQWKYGIYGLNVSAKDVVLEHFCGCCIRRRNKPVAKYPKLPVKICRPLQNMNMVIAKLMLSQERLNLINKLVHAIIDFAYAANITGNSKWRHKLSPKLYETVFRDEDSDLSEEVFRIINSEKKSNSQKSKQSKYILTNEIIHTLSINTVGSMVEYAKSLDEIDDDVGLDSFNRLRDLTRYVNGILCIALGKESVTFGKSIRVSLEFVDEVTVQAIFEVLQKVQDNIKLLRKIRAYRIAVKTERKKRGKKERKKSTVVHPTGDSTDNTDNEEDGTESESESKVYSSGNEDGGIPRKRRESQTIEMSPMVSSPKVMKKGGEDGDLDDDSGQEDNHADDQETWTAYNEDDFNM